MIAFWILAAAMVAAAVGALLPALLRRRAGSGTGFSAATVDTYRERLAELQAEHRRGNLGDAEFAEARAELERELVEGVPDDEGDETATRTGSRRAAAAVVAVAVPLVTIVLYGAVGRPGLIGNDLSHRLSSEQVQRFSQMAPAQRVGPLERYVEDNPRAPRAWTLLGEAYRAQERYGDAVTAFSRARAASEGEDPWLIARQAESLLLANGRRFTASVERLLHKALDIDPENQLALMLAGHMALSGGDRDQAAEYWQRLAATLPENGPNRAMIEQLIARAQGEAPSSVGAGRESQASTAATSGATGGDARVTVQVRLAEAMTSGLDGSTPVFVFARNPGQNSGPPLAVARTTVGALPTEVVLSDAQAMMPARKLSGADRVVLTARVALSGDVMPSSGDLEGRSEPVAVSADATATVTIDSRVQ